jgi:hypothetical protein
MPLPADPTVLQNQISDQSMSMDSCLSFRKTGPGADTAYLESLASDAPLKLEALTTKLAAAHENAPSFFRHMLDKTRAGLTSPATIMVRP